VSDASKHPRIEEIYQAMVEGASVRDIETRFGLSKSAAHRLMQKGLPEHMVKAQQAKDVVSSTDLLARLSALGDQTQAALAVAQQAGDTPTVLKAIGRLEKQLELQGRLLGQLSAAAVSVSVNLHESPEYLEIVSKLVAVLRAHPAALQAVRLALDLQEDDKPWTH
jgi:DNA-binding transcriptional regulator LsrR (DeoR family)